MEARQLISILTLNRAIAKNNNCFVGISLFEKGAQNYSKGMPKYTILEKEKIELKYNED